jgi:hypothetical protein
MPTALGTEKSLHQTGRPSHSQSLYRLSYSNRTDLSSQTFGSGAGG